MSTGVEIRILDRSANREGVAVIPQLPVRIGRNSLNDLVLAYNFVSQFHATLALKDGRLTLRDLGSTNGVIVGNQRVPPNAFVDLTPVGNAFQIVSLAIHVTVKNVEPRPGNRLKATTYAVKKVTGPQLASAPAAPQQPLPVAAPNQAHALYTRYRSAAAELIQCVQASLASCAPPQRQLLLQQYQQQFPMLASEPDFKTLLASSGSPLAPGVSGGSRGDLEELALSGLQEIARSVLPNLGAPEDIHTLATFLDKLQGTLDVFLQSFVQLRDGHRQFEADMAIKKRTSGAAQQRGTAYDLAQALLDWRHPNQEAMQGVSATFADFMIHQVALFNGVVNGVKALMREMSPEELETLAKADGGLGMGPLRYRSLWKAYEKRYKDVTEEDKRLFDLVFGETFAMGYEASLGSTRH